MVMRVHVIAVGTSILSNFEREFPKRAEELGIKGVF